MREKIDCFLPCGSIQVTQQIVAQLRGSKSIQRIFLLVSEPLSGEEADSFKDCQQVEAGNLTSSQTLANIAEQAKADYVLLQTKPNQLEIGLGALDRLVRVAFDADAAMVYADHFDIIEGERKPHPVIDYQLGSIRDDFDFGSLILVKTALLQAFASQAEEHPISMRGSMPFASS